jgi:HK97 gp10 family phage protein
MLLLASMAKGIYIEVRGLKELEKKFGRFAKEAVQAVDMELHDAANEFANLAINAAPVDQGLLRQGISAKKVGKLEYETVSQAFYSAYLEWGTKSKVEVPADLQQYAQQFRGSAGPKHDFFEMILAWVHRTGITARFSTKTRQRLKGGQADKEREYQAARAIYYSILKHGIKAQPFFFKHRAVVYKNLQKRLPVAVQKVMTK